MIVSVEFLPEAEVEYQHLENTSTGQQEDHLLALIADWMSDERAGFGRLRKRRSMLVAAPLGLKSIWYSQYPKGSVAGVAGWEETLTGQVVKLAVLDVYRNSHEFDQIVQTGLQRLTQRVITNGKL